SCSTPTHAAEAAVPLHCGEARIELVTQGGRLALHARRAVLERARTLRRLARAPSEHVARHRARLYQQLREARASARRRIANERGLARTYLLVLTRRREAARADLRRRGSELESLS